MKILFYCITFFSLFSCSGKGDFLPDDNQYSFESFPIATTKTKNKYFQFTSSGITTGDIKSLVFTKLQHNIKSILPVLPDIEVKTSSFTNLTDSLDSMTSDSAIKRTSSSKVTISDNYITIVFIGGEYYGNRKAESVQMIKFPLVISVDKNTVSFEIQPASSYQSKSGNMGSRGEILALFKPEMAKTVFSTLFNHINIDNITYRDKKRYLSLSMLSDYPVDSVYATIKTKDGYIRYSLKDDVGRGASHQFFLNGVKFVSVLKIYPYRKTTKIIYEAMAYQNVTLFSNGKSSLKPYPKKTEFTHYVQKLING